MILEMSKLKISLAGDAMLGRMVDQLQEVHLSSADGDITSKYLKHLKEQHPELSSVDQHYPLGNLLSELQNSDVNVVNLETAITTQSNPVRKTFNFRMHPQNAEILKIANISYVSLANNHILDFGKNGLIDTMHHLAKSDIAFAGILIIDLP
jgi:poly-gamma-glutamate synthesis protein (capsule biosynthesis protein)